MVEVRKPDEWINAPKIIIGYVNILMRYDDGSAKEVECILYQTNLTIGQVTTPYFWIYVPAQEKPFLLVNIDYYYTNYPAGNYVALQAARGVNPLRDSMNTFERSYYDAFDVPVRDVDMSLYRTPHKPYILAELATVNEINAKI